ncbi:hypothetical protein IEE86_06465 [Bacillus sp. 28A-2]|uniref:hypothetical protein n=1 Tax=Bacillus sp. 28A-2 TaxID=2772252 RepID=UPI00168CAFBE|nr:hypothetical protein [Bacillus sp. 28A-2]MBD3859376.1 hypothetical protein [Bacillus sp. 28A-2]
MLNAFSLRFPVSVYMYVLHLLAAYDEKKQRILTSQNAQKNSFWIYVLAVILGVVTFAALVWACKTFGKGSKFAGQFKFLGMYIKIKCG